MDIFILIICFIIFVGCIVGIVKSNTEKDEDIQTFDFNKSSNFSYNSSYKSSGDSDISDNSNFSSVSSCDSSYSDDVLRVDSTPISLPSITKEQREQLKSTVKNFGSRFNDCQGAVMSLVGMKYRSKAAKEVYCTLKFGDKISLRPDPDNVYDETAVKVFAKRCHIGYIPQEYSNTIYGYCILDKILGCYVIEECAQNRLSGVKFVIFVKS